MSDLQLTDQLKDFPTQYNADIQALQNEIHFIQDGVGAVKYTGNVTISGGLDVTDNITGTFTGTVLASSVQLSGGSNVEEALSTIGSLNEAIYAQARDFEIRAEAVRKVTPSGFSKFGDWNDSSPPVFKLSDAPGLTNYGPWTDQENSIQIGSNINDNAEGRYTSEVTVNGYNIKLTNSELPGAVKIDLPTPPTSGTRQDLVFLEVWKEEVDKETGLLFPNGNTNYSASTDVDGTPVSETQAGYTGSAYFTTNTGVYCMRANTATEEFIANLDNNIGVLSNGNFFQIRYRIRVESDVDASVVDGTNGTIPWRESLNVFIRPQGQKATSPTRGALSPDGEFIIQRGDNTAESLLDDQGVFVGGSYVDDNTLPAEVTGLSYDGFTYAIPICAIHRRNTGVFGEGNLNGTAFENAWIVTYPLADGGIGQHNRENQSLVTIGNSKFKVVDGGYDASTVTLRVVRVSGSETPSGSASWIFNNSNINSTFNIIGIDEGSYISGTPLSGGKQNNLFSRYDELYSDIIARRDVLDLRHKVSLSGEFDTNSLYQETYNLIKNEDYRQEWEKQADFDADGNGLATIANNIYGNVLLESVGIGATVPDAHINTDITRIEDCNNGIAIGFNGARSHFSDSESTEDYSFIIPDQSDPAVWESEEDDIVTYNAVSHNMDINLNNLNANGNNQGTDRQVSFQSSAEFKPVWSSGASVAGVLTKTDDYNWSFEVKQYGGVYFALSTDPSAGVGDIYEDVNSNQWVVVRSTSLDMYVLPNYSDGNTGATLPTTTTLLTKVSGLGSDVSLHASTSAEHLTNAYTPYGGVTGIGIGLGYDNSAHGIGATDSITVTTKLEYKAGSSFLQYKPYEEGKQNANITNIIKGASVFTNGSRVTLPTDVRPMISGDSSTKEINLKGFTSTKAIIDLGASGDPDELQPNNPCVLIDGSTYKMWYDGYDGSSVTVCYATSTNGIDWEKHGRVLANGTGGDFDEVHSYKPCVIKDGSTYKMWYTGSTPSNNTIGYATSTDGILWTKQGQVLDVGTGGDFDETNARDPMVIKDGSTYKMWYVGHSIGLGAFDTGYATSSDGVTWTKQGSVFSVGGYSLDGGCVIKDGDLYKMWYIKVEGSSEVYYATSTNGQGWVHHGKVMNVDYSNTAFDQVSLYRMWVIKDGSAYKFWNGGYTTGAGQYSAGIRIGCGVLAMSDPNNTGSSLLGVYTNTNPQVNHGFKANDSVVLYYERLARQCIAKTGTIPKVETRDHIITTKGLGGGQTSDFRNFVSLYSARHLIEWYKKGDNVIRYISNPLLQNGFSGNGLANFDLDTVHFEKSPLNFDFEIVAVAVANADANTISGEWISFSSTPLLAERYNVTTEMLDQTDGVGVNRYNVQSVIFLQVRYEDGTTGVVMLGSASWNQKPTIQDLTYESVFLPNIGRPLVK